VAKEAALSGLRQALVRFNPPAFSSFWCPATPFVTACSPNPSPPPLCLHPSWFLRVQRVLAATTTASGSIVPDTNPATMRHAPEFTVTAGPGYGLALCQPLGLVITSCYADNTLSAYGPLGAPGSNAVGLLPVWTMGKAGGSGASPPPSPFCFHKDPFASGALAFASSPSACKSGGGGGHGVDSVPLLLVTDAGADVVHLVDVEARACVGTLYEPEAVLGPRGVAASQSLIAVSAWKQATSGAHSVHIFEGSGERRRLRVLAPDLSPGSGSGQLSQPRGVRFSNTGAYIIVADYGNSRACVFKTDTGAFVRHEFVDVSTPFDVQRCGDWWLVACEGADEVVLRPILKVTPNPHTSTLMSESTSQAAMRFGPAGLFFAPVACAVGTLPHLGSVVVMREWGNECVHVFSAVISCP
jgi:hypothetical protein